MEVMALQDKGRREFHPGDGDKWGIGPTHRWGNMGEQVGAGKGGCKLLLSWVKWFEAGLGVALVSSRKVIALPPSSVPKSERMGTVAVQPIAACEPRRRTVHNSAWYLIDLILDVIRLSS
jgi:hypothetical protein